MTDGAITYLDAENLRAATALDALLRQLGLAFVVEDGVAWIRTPERLREGHIEEWYLLEIAHD